MPRRVPDISKVGALVGFRPTMSLDQILESVINYYHGEAGGLKEKELWQAPGA